MFKNLSAYVIIRVLNRFLLLRSYNGLRLDTMIDHRDKYQ